MAGRLTDAVCVKDVVSCIGLVDKDCRHNIVGGLGTGREPLMLLITAGLPKPPCTTHGASIAHRREEGELRGSSQREQALCIDGIKRTARGVQLLSIFTLVLIPT